MILFRSSHRLKRMVYHGAIAIRAVWRESFRLGTAEGATARKRSGTRTADSRDLWRAIAAAIHRRGAALIKSARSLRFKGQRGQADRCSCLFYFRREVAMGLKTVLYDTHVLQGAKIVDFGGWEMPLHYGSQIEEHHAVRHDAGMFDVSHMGVVDLRGDRVREF